jgi:hypothetical protein
LLLWYSYVEISKESFKYSVVESESRILDAGNGFSMQAQADAFGQIGGGPIVGVIAKGISIKVALLVSTVALIPAIALYRRALGVSNERERREI